MLPLLLCQDGKKGGKKTLLPQNLARKYGKTPVQILLRRNVQQGIIPIPKSKNPARLAENIALFDFTLEGEDMAALGGMNQNRRTGHDPLTFDF